MVLNPNPGRRDVAWRVVDSAEDESNARMQGIPRGVEALDLLVQCALTLEASPTLSLPGGPPRRASPPEGDARPLANSPDATPRLGGGCPDGFGPDYSPAGWDVKMGDISPGMGIMSGPRESGRPDGRAQPPPSHPVHPGPHVGDVPTLPLLRGSSRHAPYGMRFLALMRDGQYKMSHISGDLLDRVRGPKSPGGGGSAGGPGGLRGGLSLTPHAGEMEQLERSATFYRTHLATTGHAPTATQVCEFLASIHLDRDWRKGTALSRRNAGNFFKRLLAYLRTNQPNHRLGRQGLAQVSGPAPSALESHPLVGPGPCTPALASWEEAVESTKCNPDKPNSRVALLKLSRGSQSADTLVGDEADLGFLGASGTDADGTSSLRVHAPPAPSSLPPAS